MALPVIEESSYLGSHAVGFQWWKLLLCLLGGHRRPPHPRAAPDRAGARGGLHLLPQAEDEPTRLGGRAIQVGACQTKVPL